VGYLEKGLGPAFAHADGYGFEGFGGGSTELANEVKGGIRQGDVFVSAAAKADTALEGSANGNWVSWYSSFMATPLELAYNPRSRFGRELAHGTPWYKVLTQPGIRVGRTDPRLDPKGVLTSEALASAANRLRDPGLLKAEGRFETFPETSLVGRMQAGQLDAGFFYAVEAKVAGLRTVTLAPVYKFAEYTLTILNHAPDQAGAQAFVRYLIGASRHASLASTGLNPSGPHFVGSAKSVPQSLRGTVGAG
jgi:molybdate/tungstate transport system substrate-binding protein